MSYEQNSDQIGAWLDDEPQESGLSRTEPLDDTTIASELLIHGMVAGLLEPESKRERRIQTILQRFDSQRDTIKPLHRNRWRRISGFAVAAMTLIAIGYWFISIPASAEAIVHQVIRSTQQPVTRVYSARIHTRRFGPESIRDCKLYSHGTTKVAAVFVDAIRSPAVIGFDGQRRWLVAGHSVWTSDNDNPSPGDPFRQRLIEMVTTGTIEIHSLLTKIPAAYSLKLLPKEPLPGEKDVFCQPIEATLLSPTLRMPERIVIWAHPHTGVAIQMHVYPGENRVRGARLLEFSFDGEERVPDEFFTPEYHLLTDENRQR